MPRRSKEDCILAMCIEDPCVGHGAVTVVSAGSSSEDNTECADGLCTTLKQHPYDADPSTDCFTVAAESIPQNGYKEIDFSWDYKPTNAYPCANMPACNACTTIGKQAC